MNITWKTIIWQQFGAAIDMLGDALRACRPNCGASVCGMTLPTGRNIPSSGSSSTTPCTGSTFTCPADAFHHFYDYHFTINRKLWDSYVTHH